MIKYDESELPEVAKELIKSGSGHSVWCFDGDMGAGKTTLIKEICRELGVIDAMSSPTFSIVNEYLTQSGMTIYHFDFYRLEDEMEAFKIGIDEYLFSGKLCLVEWPFQLREILPDDYLEISIKFVRDNIREISIHPHGKESQS